MSIAAYRDGLYGLYMYQSEWVSSMNGFRVYHTMDLKAADLAAASVCMRCCLTLDTIT